jgi:hypothetical protein
MKSISHLQIYGIARKCDVQFVVVLHDSRHSSASSKEFSMMFIFFNIDGVILDGADQIKPRLRGGQFEMAVRACNGHLICVSEQVDALSYVPS